MAERRKSKAASKTGGDAPQSGLPFVRYSAILLLAGAVALAWLSLATFSPLDPPSPDVYPPTEEVHNAAGRVGSHIAYALRYWLGSGSYVGLTLLTFGSIVLLMGRRIRHWPSRVLGTVLLVVSVSACLYLLSPPPPGATFNGHAGVLGVNLGAFFRSNFGLVGGWVLLVVVLGIGLLFSADTAVYRMVGWIAGIWQHRAEVREAAKAFAAAKPVATERSAKSNGPARSARPSQPARPAQAERPQPPSPQSSLSPAGKKDQPVSDGEEQTVEQSLASRLLPFGKDRKKKDQAKAEAREPSKRKQKPEPNKAAQADAAAKPASPEPAQADTPAERPAGEQSGTPPAKASSQEGGSEDQPWSLPGMDLLSEPTGGYMETQEEAALQKRDILQQTLADFNVDAEVVGYLTGPVITLYEVSLAPGVKVSRISNLADDIARALAVPGVRVFAPLPGKDTVGVEVPNAEKETVRIRELMDSASGAQKKQSLPLYLGKDAGGDPIAVDLGAMPHLLIAGTTGSGKSVCINSIIMSLLLTRAPEEVK
ncbi:MAG: DNA translocase FtsK 4TM domain-containing protein, partial [Planctomycetota bacterium]